MTRLLTTAALVALFAAPTLAQTTPAAPEAVAPDVAPPDVAPPGAPADDVIYEVSPTTALLTEYAEAVGVASFQFNDGEGAGGAMLVETPNGVLLSLDAHGLTPGPHAFHIHETGACSPSFQAAGDHYAPKGEAHGFAVEEGAHAGDMPNIYVNEDGVARADLFLNDVTLTEGPTTLFDADGSALMIHAQPDNYIDGASAGDRAACAVIENTSAE